MNLDQRKALEELIDKEVKELNDLPDHDPRICGLILEKVKWWGLVKTALNPPVSNGYYDR